MSLASIPFKLTVAGQNAAFNLGALDLQITHVQLGSGNKSPSGTEVALLEPQEYATISGAFEISAGQHRIASVVPGSASTYEVSEIGLWAGVPGVVGATLVFYWSIITGFIAVKSANVAFNIEDDLFFGGVVPGNITIVADTQFNALAMLVQHEALPDPHNLALPFAALDYPTISTADNKITVTPAIVAGQGGKVSIPANVLISLGKIVTANKTGIMRNIETAAFTSANLNVSSTYYLRGKFVNDTFTVYVQKGTDSDAIPAGFVGTENGASGGGFDSTQLDILFAKVVTGTAGTIPTVTTLANNKNLFFFGTYTAFAGLLSDVTEPKLLGATSPLNTAVEWTKSVTLNWARIHKTLSISGHLGTGNSTGSMDGWQNKVFYTASTRYLLTAYISSDWQVNMTGLISDARLHLGASA